MPLQSLVFLRSSCACARTRAGRAGLPSAAAQAGACRSAPGFGGKGLATLGGFRGLPLDGGTPTFCLGVAAEEHTEPGARRGPARCGGRCSAAPGLLAGRSSPAPAGPAADGPAAQRPAGALPLAGPRTAPRLPAPLAGRVLPVTYDIGAWSGPSLRTAWWAGTALEGVLPVCRARGHASSHRGLFGGDGGLAGTPLALRVSERQSRSSWERADPLRGGRGCSRRSGQTRPGEREVSPQPASAPPPPALRGHWIVLAKRRGLWPGGSSAGSK